jgi:hypothetical protein
MQKSVWQQLKPEIKSKIIEDKAVYPSLVASIQKELKYHTTWSSLPVLTVTHVLNHYHDKIWKVSTNTWAYGESVLNK